MAHASLRSTGLAILGAAAAAGIAVDVAQGQTRTPSIHQEVPDDPPGPPAAARGPGTVSSTRWVGQLPSLSEMTFGPLSSVQVNVDASGANIPGDAANEPSIAVDPIDPTRIAIGWRQFDTISSNFRQAGVGYSRDAGWTWTFPGPLDPGVFRSDPVLDYDASGNFYYNSLSVAGSTFTCQVFRSTDGGASWSAPVHAFGGDKAWMCIDRSWGIGHGNVYSAWSVFGSCCGGDTLTRSEDGSQSYTGPYNLPSPPVWGTMEVGADGALYVSGRSSSTTSSFVVAKSTDAQNPGSAPTVDFTATVNLGGSLSYGGGPNPGGLLGQANIGVDNSTGPYAGNVYLLCSVAPLTGPDPMDVMIARSTDGGQSWSAPVRVNDDASGNWQWFGTLSVAPNGRLDVVWNDTRDTGQSNRSRLYYAFSLDGGATFSPNRPLSPVWNSHLGWPNQDKIGDYYDMISDAFGAHLAWSATFNGEQDVYYLRILPY